MLKFTKHLVKPRIDIFDAELNVHLGFITSDFVHLDDGDYTNEELKSIIEFKEVKDEEPNEQD